jgi:REP element-mobilizing transposase RayT
MDRARHCVAMGNTSHRDKIRKTDESTPPWNHWYHITIHVYGSWLRGDPRGWRARHHREHVEGDYKNPPPKGKYDKLYELSKALMKRDPVKIASHLRKFTADALAEKLLHDGIQVLIVSVDSKHVHILARFPDHNPRYWIAWAKKYATQSLKAHGLAVGLHLKLGEGIWAKRCHPDAIETRTHQLHVFGYILSHTKKGARVWRFDVPSQQNIE